MQKTKYGMKVEVKHSRVAKGANREGYEGVRTWMMGAMGDMLRT